MGRVLAGSPTIDLARSCLGQVSRIGRGEYWPLYDGRLMAGIAQLNLTESPFVPEALAGIAQINIWLGESDGDLEFPDERPYGDGWELRAYRSLDDLVLAEGAHVLGGLSPRQLEWEVIDDYPDYDDLLNVVDPELHDEVADTDDLDVVVGAASDGTKLGGWPSLVQAEISWAPDNAHPAQPAFVLQVDSDRDVNLNLWASGVLYIGLGSSDGRPTWVAASQFL